MALNDGGSQPPTREDDRRPFLSRPLVLAGSAVFLLAALIGGVVLVIVPGPDKTPTAEGATTPPAGASATASSSASASSCQPSASDQTVPQTAPTGLTWDLYRSIGVPVSTSAGPLQVNGDVATCYADTPVGALIASVQISARVAAAPDWRRVEMALLEPGPNRDKTLQLEAAQPTAQAAGGPGSYGQFVGFQFVTYTPQLAVIELVTRFNNGVLQASTVTMSHDTGDWRIAPQPNGGLTTTPSEVSSLAGYVAWGGVA